MNKTIYLAGGCFWGIEAYFSRVPGVIDSVSGYANGLDKNATYKNLKNTLHAETVKVVYDSNLVSLGELLLHFFRLIDPESLNKQGNDIGTQYRTGVYYTEGEDITIIEKIFALKRRIFKNFCVELAPLKHFILAEDYHQDYLEKNPGGYCHVNLNTDYNLDDNENKILKQINNELALSELSFEVLKNNATERPHTSELNKEYRRGIYVEQISGEALFSSSDKFDAGCGWPSFSKPISKGSVEYLEDNSHNMVRTEVRSGEGNNHLGHVFNDGPKDKGGLRYCINGAALKFIPYEEMDEAGYSEYKKYCE
ncbi:peptide-methionine (R)-S-oxide reductase MsrB [Mycoplasma zalophidermidis]|uniref:Peptide methionine sulfoxide reductase MsrA n=1 Tax=Mycoplasma zalophidermidis TaxID=398174 RepID=A0ABS6DRZ0_9MOLU|nr:peptide-methionine (R)-S-oxide reductase MsrB [Mycoplasma zalophidermidis]MBU4693775.1 peptide-methionine (R)-S-oxide reductase MsrB [Mycoplasma zalophidermidis]